MLRYLTIFSVVIYTCSSNSLTVWINNEKLIENIELVSNKLAHTSADADNRVKRAHSVISLAILRVLEEGPLPLGGSEASQIEHKLKVSKTLSSLRINLNLPSEVIAGPARRDLEIIKSIIIKPSMIIQKHCGPKVSNVTCLFGVVYDTATEHDKCHNYLNHVDLFHHALRLSSDASIINLLKDLQNQAQKGKDDLKNLAYVAASVISNPKEYLKLLMWYRKLKLPIYDCLQLDNEILL